MDFAELAFEGVPLVAEHYDKVTDPLTAKTKQGYQKVKQMRERRRGGGGYESETESDYEEVDRYGPPQRSQTSPRRRSKDDYDDRRRSRRGDVVEERYAYSKSNGRAKSMGRDDRYGGRDSQRKSVPLLLPLHLPSLIIQRALVAITPTPNPPSPHHAENAENPSVKKLS